MTRPIKAPRGLRRRIKTLKREVLNDMENYHFHHHCTQEDCTSDSEEESLRQNDDPSRIDENICSWLLNEKTCMTMDQVRLAFAGVTTNDLELKSKEEIVKRVRKLSPHDLLPCCEQLDGFIEESGLAEAGLFLYQIFNKYALVEDTCTKPKLRVMFALLLGMMHQSFGPEIVLHILVHFMTDLDRTLENICKSVKPRITSLKLDNMISFVCYLMAARTCSLKFLETILQRIGNRPEEKIKKNVKRILRLTNGLIEKPDRQKLEKILVPYQSTVTDTDNE